MRELSPGIALVAGLIRRSIEQRMGQFNFLRGQERYKLDLGAELIPLHSVTVVRPAWRRASRGHAKIGVSV